MLTLKRNCENILWQQQRYHSLNDVLLLQHEGIAESTVTYQGISRSHQGWYQQQGLVQTCCQAWDPPINCIKFVGSLSRELWQLNATLSSLLLHKERLIHHVTWHIGGHPRMSSGCAPGHNLTGSHIFARIVLVQNEPVLNALEWTQVWPRQELQHLQLSLRLGVEFALLIALSESEQSYLIFRDSQIC